MRAVLLVAALVGCDLYDRVADADGEVYECQQADGATVELCYFADSSAELADRLGASSCGLTDRWWPVLTNAIGRGCRYQCPPPGPGCNATGGCYCPDDSARTRSGNAPSPPPTDIETTALQGEVGGGWSLASYVSAATWNTLIGYPVVELTACDSERVKPAIACRAGYAVAYDGCRWGCVATLPDGARQ